MDIREVTAKSILTKSTLKTADYDYSINPYIGCRFGCVYCYASFMGRFVGKKVSDWGSYVFVKTNAPELLSKELPRIAKKGKGKALWFSSVTDPYQGVEATYQLTRKCLNILADYGFEGSVGILTKSNLVVRDIDLFKRLKHPDIGLTITSTDDKISQYFERFAPPVSARLRALKRLNDEGFQTYAFLGPLLPHVLADEIALEKLFASVAETGNKDIYVEYLNLSPYILGRMKREIGEVYDAAQSKAFRKKWDAVVSRLVQKYQFNLRFGGTLYHPEMN